MGRLTNRTKGISVFTKTNRTFSSIRKSAWLITLAVAIGGQFFPPLGLLVPVIMVSLMGMSIFKGRFWCGNFCPHGSFFDFLLMPLSRNKKIPSLFTSKITIVLFFFFFMFNLTQRFITTVFQNAQNIALYYRVGMIFSTTYLIVLIAGGLLAVLISPRTWCQFCPMGSIQALFYKLGKKLGVATTMDEKVTVEHPLLCRSCGKCAQVCPMQLEPYMEFSESCNQFNDERCIRCLTCIKNCPAGILCLSSNTQAKPLKRMFFKKGGANR